MQQRTLFPRRVRPGALFLFLHSHFASGARAPDLSGRGNDVAQASAPSQPSKTTDSGVHSLLFSGTQRMLNTSLSGVPAASGNITTMFAGRITSGVNNGMYAFAVGDVVNSGHSVFDEGTLLRARTVSPSAALTWANDTAAHVIESTHTTAERTVRVDGGTAATDATSRTLPALTHLSVGSLGGSVFPANMHLYALCAWSAILSAAELTAVRQWFGHEFGVDV